MNGAARSGCVLAIRTESYQTEKSYSIPTIMGLSTDASCRFEMQKLVSGRDFAECFEGQSCSSANYGSGLSLPHSIPPYSVVDLTLLIREPSGRPRSKVAPLARSDTPRTQNMRRPDSLRSVSPSRGPYYEPL